MLSLITSLILFFLFSFIAPAGNTSPVQTSSGSPRAESESGDYEAGRFVLRLNTKGLELFTPITKESALFKGLNIEITKIESFAKGIIESPRKNSLSPRLSSIYKISYSGELPLDAILKKLNASAYIEYAEPYYLDKIQFIPNDPAVHNGDDMFYLKRYGAFEAWEETRGDTNIVIGVIDTGVRYSHEDLKSNLKYNTAEANGLPGVDDDNDGYVDNVIGWDFGDKDNNPDATGHEHGTIVAGIAAATVNNGKGIAGTGFKCKYLPLKASIDSLAGVISHGYEALIYAAYHGCGVVNLSWGRTGSFSRMAQDIIDYVVLEKDLVIVAAAGNTGKEEAFYPASYNHVLSVASADTIFSPTAGTLVETRHTTGTYHHTVDLCAQGKGVYGTTNNGAYHKSNGSSNAAPLVSGAAALVRSKFPNLSALQVIERLRITGDLIDSFPENALYKEKIGRRLNMHKALTQHNTPSVRITSSSFNNQYGQFIYSGDTVKLLINVTNYLAPTSNCQATLSSDSPYIEISRNTYSLGPIPTMGSKNNEDDPFILVIKEAPDPDMPVTFRIQFDDGDYYDYQYIEYMINPSWITVKTPETELTISGSGRIGYIDNASSIGDGFRFNHTELLYEAGLLLATSDSTVSDCVREFDYNIKQDFKTLKSTRYIPSRVADIQTQARFSDEAAKKPIGVTIVQNSYAWPGEDDAAYQIIEYNFTNTTAHTIDTLYAGIFADWDINDPDHNKAEWDDEHKLGYVYDPEPDGLYAGISLLTNEIPTYFALDHQSNIPGNINPNDGFTSREKFLCMRKGVSKTTAGYYYPDSSDVSNLTGAIILGILPGESRKVAFAFLGGTSLDNLKQNAAQAKKRYRSFNTGPVPQIEAYHFCEGDTVSLAIHPENGTLFGFYTNETQPLATGDSLYLRDIDGPQTFYVTNLDSLFESAPAIARILFHKNPEANFMIQPTILNLWHQTYAEIIPSSTPSIYHRWEIGELVLERDDTFTRHFTEPDTILIRLTVSDEYGCSDSKAIRYPVIYETITGPLTASEEERLRLYPNPAGDFLYLNFGDDDTEKEVRIIDMIGNEIARFNGSFSKKELHVEPWASGTYLMIITRESGQTVRPFVKY